MKHRSWQLLIVCILISNTFLAQKITFETIIANHQKTFKISDSVFSGGGWALIADKVKQVDNVLIGEEHFTNEIPLFTKHIFNLKKFDNFYIELDPYSTEIIETSIKLTEKKKEVFNQTYKDLFSFYALRPEYELLEDIVKTGTNLLGSDQVLMYADRLIFHDLYIETENNQARKLYKEVIDNSNEYLKKFFENPQNPMYLMTPEFGEKIKALQELKLSKHEHEVINAMRSSVEIYKSRSKGHHKRVKLLKRHLMRDYEKWSHKSNLFKYGANHLTKGESLLEVYDIGNLVSNISEANDQKSLHIMIVGQSGMLGQPFKIFPAQPVDITTWPLKNLTPFLTAQKNQWKVFDLQKIIHKLKKQKIKVDDTTLNRILKGYDLLVIIPEVTAAKF